MGKKKAQGELLLMHVGVSDDVLGAAFVAFFAAMVLLAYHKMPHVNEALHFYKENDQRLFITMRACHLVISTAMALNAKFLVVWIVKAVWRWGRL